MIPFLQSHSGLTSRVSSIFANNEPGVWLDPSDFSTMFQDSAGTVPVTAVEQPVGLMLDKSKGMVLGPELVTNGTFDTNLDGWSTIAPATAIWTSSGIQISRNITSFVSQAASVVNLVAGRTYKVSLSVTSAPSAGNASLGIFAANRSTERTAPGTVLFNTAKDFAFIFTASVTEAAYVVCGISGVTAGTVTFDNISVRELLGNHALQTTTTSRPVLSARVNLLTKTEQFEDTSVWSVGAAVTADTTVAPNATQTADTVTVNNQATMLYQANAANGDGSYIAEISLTKASGDNFFYFYVSDAGNNYAGAWVNLVTMQLGTVTAAGTFSGTTATLNQQENGFKRLRLNLTKPATTSSHLGFSPCSSDGSFTRVIGQNVILWGASLVSADQAHLPYQRVNTATDYDTAGFPHYLRFDGVDDFLSTTTITPGTDKVQVFAGVRKLRDAAVAVVADLGPGNTAGSFVAYIQNPFGYGFNSVGSASTSAAQATTAFQAPITNTLAGLGDISGDSTILRINGTQAAINTADQGTGNYLAYPLYIGRRGGTTLPFNGHLYSLIVRFGSNLPIETIENTEKYINGLTKAY